jgi:hypothetical protein
MNAILELVERQGFAFPGIAGIVMDCVGCTNEMIDGIEVAVRPDAIQKAVEPLFQIARVTDFHHSCLMFDADVGYMLSAAQV